MKTTEERLAPLPAVRYPWRQAAVLVVASILAAALQESIAPSSATSLVPPLLLSVVLYFTSRRRWPWALAAAVVCGVLEDALAGLPAGFSTACFVVGWGLCHVSRSHAPRIPRGHAGALLAGAALAPLFQLVQWLTLRIMGTLAPVPYGWLLLRLAHAALLGAVCALVVSIVLRTFDWLCENEGELSDDGKEVHRVW